MALAQVTWPSPRYRCGSPESTASSQACGSNFSPSFAASCSLLISAHRSPFVSFRESARAVASSRSSSASRYFWRVSSCDCHLILSLYSRASTSLAMRSLSQAKKPLSLPPSATWSRRARRAWDGMYSVLSIGFLSEPSPPYSQVRGRVLIFYLISYIYPSTSTSTLRGCTNGEFFLAISRFRR